MSNGESKVTVLATLRRNADGAVKVIDQSWKKQHADGAYHCWTEGNYSCDCNRTIFFEGVDIDDPTAHCGDERYTLLSLVANDIEITVTEEAERLAWHHRNLT